MGNRRLATRRIFGSPWSGNVAPAFLFAQMLPAVLLLGLLPNRASADGAPTPPQPQLSQDSLHSNNETRQDRPNELETGSHGVPLDLQTALQWTLQYNPTLIATRQNAAVSVEALAVARQFPTSLNPSVSVTLQPWVFARNSKGAVQQPQTLVSVTWSQPVELGGRTAYRTAMAQASYDQTRWNILQAELSTLVETYRAPDDGLPSR